jgi:glycosyltransferase involved in cell wall biosynthesis
MKIALVADWLTTFGGAEHVLEEFHALWPEAPFFTSVARREALGPLADADIRVTSLQRLYRLVGKHQALLPFLPRALESINLTGYDVVLSSSHAVGKGVIPPPSAAHVCYCHTPMRYAWEMEAQYLDDFRVPQFLRARVRGLLRRLRRWDLSTAKRVDTFIANSRETQERIERIYGRASTVVAPPVNDRFLAAPLTPREKRRGYLAIGRLVPYKRFDLLVDWANATKNELTIAGRGQEEARLRGMAGPTVRFAGFVPDADLPGLYGNAKALLFPTHEDAGIVPLEAQASGTPVIAYGRGGARDSVQDGETGLFFPEQTMDALRAGVERFETMTIDPATVRKHTSQFSSAAFREKMTAIVKEAHQKFGL